MSIETVKDKTPLYCSFCGKSQHDVERLIAGPTVFICNECVLLCSDIMENARIERAVQRYLDAQGIEARQGHDPQGHGAKHESPVAEGDAPKGSPHAP